MYKSIFLFLWIFIPLLTNAGTWSTPTLSADSFKTCSYHDVLNNRLYFSSTVINSDNLPVSQIVYVDSDTCITLPYSILGFINSIIFYDDKLIVGGKFEYVNDAPIANLVRIDSNGCTGFGINDSIYASQVNSMQIYNGLLFIGGNFENEISIMTWNGTVFTEMSECPKSNVKAMFVFQDELYVGGKFDHISDLYCKNIAKWNGDNWDSVRNGLNGPILSMVEYDNLLIVGGMFIQTDSSNFILSIAYLDNDQWNPLDTGVYSVVTSMTIYNDELYIGGVIGKAGGLEVHNIARWDGTEWGTCNNGITDTMDEDYVSSLAVFDDSLYIFGRFDTANNTSCNNIAKYHY